MMEQAEFEGAERDVFPLRDTRYAEGSMVNNPASMVRSGSEPGAVRRKSAFTLATNSRGLNGLLRNRRRPFLGRQRDRLLRRVR